MKYIRLLLPLLFILLVGCNDTTKEKEEQNVTLTISAAASLNESLTEIKDRFEKEHSHIKVVLNFGGSGSLQQQIKQGAPVDLFFSAAEEPFNELIEEKLIDQTNHANLVKNSLVLITPMENKVSSLDDLKNASIERIAIGTPETVPAGLYAKQTLISRNLWDSVQKKTLIRTKDVRQVLTYVETGNVDVGFVYNTDALSSKKIKVVAEIPEELHEPIVYPAGIISSTKNKEAAILFYEFLKNDTSTEIFNEYGFGTIK